MASEQQTSEEVIKVKIGNRTIYEGSDKIQAGAVWTEYCAEVDDHESKFASETISRWRNGNLVGNYHGRDYCQSCKNDSSETRDMEDEIRELKKERRELEKENRLMNKSLNQMNLRLRNVRNVVEGQPIESRDF